MTTYTAKPTRYGYVLRRLAAGKTSAINWRVADKLQQAGLVTFCDPRSRQPTVRVTITDAGRELAKASAKGITVAERIGVKPREDRRR